MEEIHLWVRNRRSNREIKTFFCEPHTTPQLQLTPILQKYHFQLLPP